MPWPVKKAHRKWTILHMIERVHAVYNAHEAWVNALLGHIKYLCGVNEDIWQERNDKSHTHYCACASLLHCSVSCITSRSIIPLEKIAFISGSHQCGKTEVAIRTWDNWNVTKNGSRENEQQRERDECLMCVCVSDERSRTQPPYVRTMHRMNCICVNIHSTLTSWFVFSLLQPSPLFAFTNNHSIHRILVDSSHSHTHPRSCFIFLMLLIGFAALFILGVKFSDFISLALYVCLFTKVSSADKRGSFQ